MTKFNHFPQLSVVQLKVVLAQTVESGEKYQTMQVGNLLLEVALGVQGLCFEISVSCLLQKHGSCGYQPGGSVLEAGL